MDNSEWLKSEIVTMINREKLKCLATIQECMICMDRLHMVLSALVTQKFSGKDIQDIYRVLIKYESLDRDKNT